MQSHVGMGCPLTECADSFVHTNGSNLVLCRLFLCCVSLARLLFFKLYLMKTLSCLSTPRPLVTAVPAWFETSRF